MGNFLAVQCLELCTSTTRGISLGGKIRSTKLCGVVWCGVCDMILCGVIWYGMIWCGMIWIVWCGMVCYGIV